MSECRVHIEDSGAISVSDEVVIDGHRNIAGKTRVVTHIHSDHIIDLMSSIRNSYKLIGTNITLSWLSVLGYSAAASSMQLSYNSRIKVGSINLEFVKGLHIPGTAQVLVVCEDGHRVLYSSDFKKPGEGTPIVEADTLVIDAVYGRPTYVRLFDDDIEMLLVGLVKQLLSEGAVHIYGYYGKINEVMEILRSGGVDAPFVLPPKVYMMTKKVESLGHRLKDYILLGSREADDVVKSGWYVYLDHMMRTRNRVSRGINSIVLSGWEFKKPIKKLTNHMWHVAFSDHSDFRGLIRYVAGVNPRRVYVVKARSNGAEEFAGYLLEKLGIKEVLVV
ncbi:MAG: MBL fold metallo-hydrolase RNA specificity domain-containing protein [Sulfolobales archaeon]|nr:MBL fold metallo-hydrolase [Sulfolobales archaeon]MDW8083319.1 MBL fold metallo-hydrolase RNA specificity domain-containing protein [Sulfolobales archaeon]